MKLEMELDGAQRAARGSLGQLDEHVSREVRPGRDNVAGQKQRQAARNNHPVRVSCQTTVLEMQSVIKRPEWDTFHQSPFLPIIDFDFEFFGYAFASVVLFVFS
jgi:hypothetical protein